MIFKPYEELGDMKNWRLVLGYGIINPFGPTLDLLLSEKKEQKDGKHRIALIEIHPFSPHVVKAWNMRKDDEDERKDIIWSCVHQYECTPTLYIPGDFKCLDIHDNLYLLTYVAAGKENGERTLSEIKKYEGDPIKRIGEQMKLKDPFNKENSVPLGLEKAEELVRTQIKSENFYHELSAFDYGFHGAIDFMGGSAELMADDAQELVNRLLEGEWE